MEDISIQKAVVILVGPPGSGKDTQAERLTEEMGFVQVPSSRIIRAKFADNPDDPVIQEQRRIFDAGKLNDPKLVSEWVMEFVRPLAAQGRSLVFSGSPRTPHEADVEIPALQDLYGRPNVILIYLDVGLEIMRQRIAGRRFCRAHGHVIADSPVTVGLTKCPQDGSELYRRDLDAPELVPVRLREFTELTRPVVDIARQYGVPVFTLDGDQSIEALHQEIAAVIERRQSPVPSQ
jgi:adenylate kinase